MKKYLIFLVLFLMPSVASASISFVQHAEFADNTTNFHTTSSITLSNVASGDLLVFSMSFANSIAQNPTATVVDTNGTPVLVTSTLRNNSNGRQSVLYEQNAASGTHTFNVTYYSSQADFVADWATEYSGADTSAALVASSFATSSAGTALSSGNMTTTAPNEMIYGLGIAAGATTLSAPGFTLRTPFSVANQRVEDNVTSTLASGISVSSTFTGTTSTPWADIGVLFKPSVSSVTPAAPMTFRWITEE